MFRVLCSAFTALLLTVSFAFAAPVTFRLGHIAEPQHPYGQGAEKMAELVKAKTNGAVQIQVFPSSQLGGQRDLIESLTLGNLDMTLTSTAVLGNFIPEMSVFDLPFIFRDVYHAYKALDTVGMELGKLGEAKGLKVLAFMENGVRHMTNNRQPIRKPEDVRGLKIRVMEQPVYIEMIKALGGSPTPMAFGEIYTALQKGVIDGEENPLPQIWTARFFEVQKYVSLTAHTYSPEPILIAVSSWNKLSPDQQKALREAAEEASAWQRDLCRELEADYIKKINASGTCTVNDGVDLEAFAKATRGTWKFFADKVKGGQELIDKVVNTK